MNRIVAASRRLFDTESPDSSNRRRIATVVVGISVFAIAFGIVLSTWSLSSSSDGPAHRASEARHDPAGSPVAHIECAKAGVSIKTPVVEVQPDGLHLLIDRSIGRPAVTVSSGGRSVTIVPSRDAEYPLADVVSFPPGDATIACGPNEEAMGSPEPIQLVDSIGTYHDAGLACDFADARETPRLGTFDTATRSVVDGIRGLTPGVLPSDEISYAEYRQGEWGGTRYRIIRDGSVVATVDVASSDKTTVVGPLYACPGTGIG